MTLVCSDHSLAQLCTRALPPAGPHTCVAYKELSISDALMPSASRMASMLGVAGGTASARDTQGGAGRQAARAGAGARL